jgi:hypothetical protein
VKALKSTMIAAHDLPEPDVTSLVHYSEALDVLIWAPEEV